MQIVKNSEKILIWMHRERISGKEIAEKLGTSRQNVSKKLRENSFSNEDLRIIREQGFKY